jgi:hypothetical protein
MGRQKFKKKLFNFLQNIVQNVQSVKNVKKYVKMYALQKK